MGSIIFKSFESVLTMKQKFNLSVLRFIQLNQFAANEIVTKNIDLKIKFLISCYLGHS